MLAVVALLSLLIVALAVETALVVVFGVVVVETALVVVFGIVVVVVETALVVVFGIVVVVVETALVVFGVDKSFQIDSRYCQCHFALIFLHHHEYQYVFSVLASFGFEIWVSTLQ